MKVLAFNKNRTICLTRTRLGISWLVPLKVAERWDNGYEMMRVAAMFDLLELGHHAVLLDSVQVELGFEEFEHDDGQIYRKAIGTCSVYDLRPLPEHLRDNARKVCHAMSDRPVIEFQLLNPVTSQPLGSSDSD